MNTSVDNSTSHTYTLWGNIGGWLVAFFLTKKALTDRDKRLNDMDVWKQEHEKNHPNVNELLRMHEENRELMQHIMDLLQKNNLTRETDFRHLNERIDRMMEKK